MEFFVDMISLSVFTTSAVVVVDNCKTYTSSWSSFIIADVLAKHNISMYFYFYILQN